MNLIDKFNVWRRQQRWNRQYKKGYWENLNSDSERVRYETIAGFILKHGIKKPTILDLGCGEGILGERLKNLDYSYLFGMDFSSVSIDMANALQLKNAEFFCADIHTFVPKQKYDVIVFNEVFYYIHDSEKQNVLKRMISHLNDNGIIITSIFKDGTGCWEYFEHELKQLDFVKISSENGEIYWKVGAYKTN